MLMIKALHFTFTNYISNMKNRYVFLISLFLLAFDFVIAQDLKIEGKIIDKNTNDPIFGATIRYSGRGMSFSDNAGYFQLLLTNPVLKDSITISHLTYQNKSISLLDLKSDTNLILIEERTFPIDEVSVKPIKVVKLLKEIKNQFRRSYPHMPCWGEANYSQLISYKGQPCSYLECNGNMLLIGNKENNPFVNTFCIPSQVRRTKEKPILAKVVLYPTNEAQRLQVSGLYMNYILTEYRFFEVCHPLSPHLVNNFDFHLDSISKVNNTSCYLFSFTQKSKIGCVGWNIYGMKGQMWIDTNNYHLLKIDCVFNRGDVASNQIDVEYKCLGNTIYPLNISIHHIHNKYLTKILSQKIFVESNINFGKIDVTERDYARKYSYGIESYLPYFNYNKAFWMQHPIKDSCLKTKVLELMDKNNWDSEFEKGSSEKVFVDSKTYDSVFKKSSDATIDVMKRDFKRN